MYRDVDISAVKTLILNFRERSKSIIIDYSRHDDQIKKKKTETENKKIRRVEGSKIIVKVTEQGILIQWLRDFCGFVTYLINIQDCEKKIINIYIYVKEKGFLLFYWISGLSHIEPSIFGRIRCTLKTIPTINLKLLTF